MTMPVIKINPCPAPAGGSFTGETPVNGNSTARTTTVSLLLSTVMLISAAPAFGGGPAVILDSLSGKAEVQRAGSTQWTPVGADEKLYNNDVVRIVPGGVGRLRWPDKTVAFMRGGSQILVNLAPPREKNRLRNYATVFMGTVFFIIRKVLPREPEEDIQIYTPTSVLTIRGTSFEINVQPGTGTTGVKMVCGTIRVKCIETNAAAFLGAPFKTVIMKRTDTIVTSAVLTSDLDSLRGWVPHEAIDAELAAHLAQGKRDRMIISGRMDEKCIVIPFVNKSNYGGTWDIERRIPHMLAERLRQAHKRLNLTVIDSAGQAPGDAAAGEKARFVISGTIPFFDIVNRAEITVRADEYHERSIGRLSLELRLFDAAEKTILYETTVTGERTGKKNVENSWTSIEKLPFDLKNDRFAASIIGSALDQALDAAVEKLINALYE